MTRASRRGNSGRGPETGESSMRIQCPQCSAQYNVDESRIPSQGVQIKCPKCTHAFVVTPPAAAPPPPPSAEDFGGESTRVMTDGDLPPGWADVAKSGGSGAVPLPGAQRGPAAAKPASVVKPAASGGAVPLPGASKPVAAGAAVPLPGAAKPAVSSGSVPPPSAEDDGAQSTRVMSDADAPPGWSEAAKSGGSGAVPLPGASKPVAAGGAVPLPGASKPVAAGGAVPLPGATSKPVAAGGAVPLPGAASKPVAAGGAVPLPGATSKPVAAGGAVPLPGAGGVSSSFGDGAIPLPGGGPPKTSGGGAVPLPGFASVPLGDEAGFPDDAGFPLPGASGDMPLGEEEPEFADADAVSDADFPLPGGDALGDSGFPLPGVAPAAPSAFPLPGGPAPGASAPLGGGGFNIPLPGSGDGWPPAGGANEPDPFASSPASSPFPGAGMSMDDEVVPMPSPSAGPSRGSRGDGPPGGRVVRNEDSVVAPFHGGTGIGPKAGQPLDNSVLDFIDSEAGEARTKKRVWRIRKRNGKVLGPHDEATLLKMIQSQDLQGNEEASEDGAFWKPMSQVPALADEIQRMMLNALDGPGGLPGGDVPQEPDTGQEVVEEVAPVKGKKGQKPPKEDQGGERTRVPWKLLVAAVLVFGLVGGAAYTHFFMPDAGVLGWKWVMAKVKPPEEKKPDPADLVKKPIPVWQDTTVETLILEDNLASYEEAARKLEAQLATGKLGAAIPLARSLVLAAVMDGQAAKADEALLALQRVEGADPRAVAAVKALALLAKGDADGALKTALEAAGAGAPELKDQPAQVRTALSDLESAAAFALLRKGKTEEALTRFDWALMASPQSVVATVGQARALQVAGDSQTALAYLERAVAIQPDNLRARVLAGELLLKAKNSKQAKVHLLVVAGPTGAKGTPAQRAAAKRMLSDVALEEKDIKAATDYMAAASAETPQDLDLKVRAGQLNLRLRQFPQALAVFDDVLKVKPDDESAIVGSAAAKLGATDALGAYKQVMDAAAKFPQSPQLKYWLGVAAEAMTKTQEAEASFKQSMVLDPKRAAPVVALAQFSIKDRKYQEAITRLQEARARVAPEEEHWLRATLAQVYVKQRNFALAFKEFEAALTAAPDNAEARARYGAALREAGRFDQAKKHLQDALSDDPRNAMILAEMGTYFQTQGMYDKAIDFYQQAIAIAPKDDDYFVRMGSATYAKGDASGAVEFLKTAQSLNPTNPDVSYWMGLVLRKSEPEKAKGLFKQGMDLAPEDDRFDHEMGRTFANEGVFIEAIDHLRNAIRKNPNNGDAHFDLGKALQEQARHVDAREHYNRAVDLMPQKAFIRLWLADTFNKTGEYAEAARQYRVAIEKDSTLTDAYCKLADVYRNDTKFRQAAGMYEKCLEQQPNHKEAWKWMGYTYEAMGGKFSKKALDAWQKHVKANPEDGDNDVLREKIADLR